MPSIQSSKEQFVVHENCGARIYGHPVTLTTDEGEEIHTHGCLVISKSKPFTHGDDDLNKHTFNIHVEVDVDISVPTPIAWGDKNDLPSNEEGEDN